MGGAWVRIAPPERPFDGIPGTVNWNMLIEGREARGLSREEVAEKMSAGYTTTRRETHKTRTGKEYERNQIAETIPGIPTTAADVAAWERAERVIPPECLRMMAGVLNYPPHFFTQADKEDRAHHFHISGDGVEMCAHCYYAADYLCDFPLGNGKTCDTLLCEKHAIEQGGADDDLHFCPTHALIAAGMVRTVNASSPPPPAREGAMPS